MMRMKATLFAVWMSLGMCATTVMADDPLHVRIDAMILAKAPGKPAAAVADDAEFMRRIALDLTGQTPTTAEVRKFLGDTAPDKRQKLIDEYLAGADYPRRM